MKTKEGKIVFLDHIVQLRHLQRMHTYTSMNTRMQTLPSMNIFED